MTVEICCGLASNDKDIFGSSHRMWFHMNRVATPTELKTLKEGCKMVIQDSFTVKRIESFRTELGLPNPNSCAFCIITVCLTYTVFSGISSHNQGFLTRLGQ